MTNSNKNKLSDEALKEIAHYGNVYRNKSLAQYSRWKIGGIADAVVAPSSAENLAQLMTYLTKQKIPYVTIGSSSNLLFADEGLNALVILLGDQISGLKISGTKVTAQCGLWVPKLSLNIANAGLIGAEHMIGIPGTLGGLICMNGGSQRKGVGDHIVNVRTVSPTGEHAIFSKEQCEFAYRKSIFQRNGHIIVEADFEYPLAVNKKAVKQNMLAILQDRRRKFPKKLPNCGSVFVSDPAMYSDYGPPGAVIEYCDLKGITKNQAQISPMHANFIVNNGGASATDVLFLIHLIRETVQKKTGYLMPAEVRYVMPDGSIIPAHEKAQELYA